MHRHLIVGVLMIAVITTLGSPAAWAHNPVVINGGPTNASNAHLIPDISISRVGYHNATTNAPEMWYTFNANAGDTLYAQSGIPKIERYSTLRPVMVLLGPGLPAVEVPFDVPEGYGGYIFPSEGLAPVEFDEEFTGTKSWQFPEIKQTLPVTGKYYLVGYVPGDTGGKFWVAMGRSEVFGLLDIIALPVIIVKVRLFHEIFPVGGLLSWVYLGLVALIAGLVSLLAKVFA